MYTVFKQIGTSTYWLGDFDDYADALKAGESDHLRRQPKTTGDDLASMNEEGKWYDAENGVTVYVSDNSDVFND